MQSRKILGMLAVSLLAAFVTTSARGDVIPPCPVPTGASSISLQEAPPALWRRVTRGGEIVPPGADFDSTDLQIVGKSRRLIFIWNRGPRWVVATEHGGLAYNDPISAYDLSDDKRHVTFIKAQIAFPKTVCSTALELLNFQSSK
jgi:hypothetical protein